MRFKFLLKKKNRVGRF